MWKKVCIVLTLMSGTHHAMAENSFLIRAFGGEPGSALPHVYSYGAPTEEDPLYTLRVSVLNEDIKNIFYDTVLTVRASDKIVVEIKAQRAFRTLNSCQQARAIILQNLTEGLPEQAVSGGNGWLRQSLDGKVFGRVICDQRRHYPMPVLRLTLAYEQ